jgi:hypothetical protein
MLTMTEAAGGFLCKVLDDAHASPDTAVRVLIDGDALASTLDKPRPGDSTFVHEGRKVLVLDEQVSELLAERTLDVRSTHEGTKLAFA